MSNVTEIRHTADHFLIAALLPCCADFRYARIAATSYFQQVSVMGAKSLLAIAGVAVMTLVGLIYVAATWESPQGTTTIVVPAPVTTPTPEPVRQIPSAPVIATPDPVVEVVEAIPATPTPAPVQATPAPVIEVVELPSLNDSDGWLLSRLRALQNGMNLAGLLVDSQLIRTVVVYVDNVARGELPDTNLPYRAMQQEMPVRNLDDNLFEMDEAAHHRFDRALGILLAMDSEQLMGLYRMTSPLFQQAYTELGYRDVRFDTVLRRAIMTVLQYEDIPGPYQLVKPSVMYLYADSTLEALPDVQKQLIRLGPENTEKLKTKLREILQQL